MLEKIINSIKNIAKPLIFAGTLAIAANGCYEDYYNDNSEESEEFTPTYSLEETQKNQLMHEGVNLTSWWWDDYGKQEVIDTLDTLHGLGVESVSVLTTYYQDTTFSPTQINESSYKTPTDEGIERVIKKAQSLGMRTVLKPHVDPYNGTWRGYITFGDELDWAEWFNSYNDFIMHYAELAEDNNVDMLIIGTELEGTVHRPEWNDIIENIRSVFSGEITYAANHDGYQFVPFWDKLDYIGIDAYFSLTASFDPTLSELVQAWDPIVQELRDFSESYNKKIVITEVGYQSYDGTNMTPWWSLTSTVDEQEQADCYEAFLSAFHNQDFIEEIDHWMSYHDPYQDVNGFDFINKQAGLTIDYYYHLMD